MSSKDLGIMVSKRELQENKRQEHKKENNQTGATDEKFSKNEFLFHNDNDDFFILRIYRKK